jgi:hypothetical protein
MFVYAIRSPYTKESYFRRLQRFFDFTNFCKDEFIRDLTLFRYYLLSISPFDTKNGDAISFLYTSRTAIYKIRSKKEKSKVSE